jgi:hypothetical protein
MGFLRNIKHATNRNWHWALDQYVSPKNNIKSCQKYMKVVEYWHGTIKNYRYDRDVSRPAATPAAPAHRSPSPPPHKQGKKTAAAAPSAPASSSTARGGRQYRFGPSLKPLEKLPYERTVEENVEICEAYVKDFFAKKIHLRRRR